MSLISLVYVSFASYDLTDEQLKDILQESRENNRTKNITGMLLYRNHCFIQALEGEEDEVKRLYQKIQSDPRHENIVLVHTGPIESRTFPGWSMGFNKISDQDAANLPGFTAFLNDPRDVSYFTDHPDRATRLLNSFKNRIYW
jgi:hypothetical protein